MHLIFDFDGTLVDSFVYVIKKFNILADDFNFRKVAEDEIEKLRDLNSKELIKHLKIPIYKIPCVLYKARKHLQSEMHKLIPFPGIPKALQDLTEAGFSLGIVTSNSKENVTQWLEYQNIKKYFDFIHIESSYFGKKKILKKVMKFYRIKEAIYIGDETRDIEAAKECHMSSIAVAWGFNSEKVLGKYNPSYIAKMPEDLVVLGLNHFEKLAPVHSKLNPRYRTNANDR